MLYFRSLAQFYCISLLCAEYFVQDCLSKQIFCCNMAQSLSHLNFWKISVTSKHFSNHDKNIQQIICVKSYKFNGFVLALFCILGLGQHLTSENFELSRLVIYFDRNKIFEPKLILFPEI